MSLGIAQCRDYEIVKAEILKAYEVTAEFYHAKFRQCRKDQNMSFTDFGHVICKYLNKWLTTAKVSTFEELREALCLEQFLSRIPYEIRVYIREREVATLMPASHSARCPPTPPQMTMTCNFRPNPQIFRGVGWRSDNWSTIARTLLQ